MEKRSLPPNPQAALIQSLRVVQALWLVELVLAAAIWLLVPLFAPGPRAADGTGGIIALAFYAVGLADIIFGVWLRERAFGQARAAAARSAPEVLGRIVGPSLAAVTLALTPAILGLMLYLVFGNRAGLSVLCVLSLIGLALHRPRQDRWQEILSPTGIHAHRPA
ncbi:MAG: hypothetical protein ACRDIC_08995 [bacterium]